jgi:hypothetical protein
MAPDSANLDFVVVFESTNNMAAEAVRLALQAEEIPCILDNRSQGGFSGVFPVKVLVPAEHRSAAERVIGEREVVAEDETDEADRPT